MFLLLFIGSSSVGVGVGNQEGTLQISTHIVEEHDPGAGSAPEKAQEEIAQPEPPKAEQKPEPVVEKVVEKKVEPKPVEVKEKVVEKEPEVIEPIKEEVVEVEDNMTITEVEKVVDNETVTEVEDNETITEKITDIVETGANDNATEKPAQVAGVNSPSAVVGGGGADGGDGAGAALSKGGSSGIFSLIDVDIIPKFLRNKKPEYPSYAKENRITGSVRIGFLVDTNGRVKDPVIIKATPPNVFEKSALATVQTWRFEPARKGGEKVVVKMAITLNFNLEDIDK